MREFFLSLLEEHDILEQFKIEYGENWESKASHKEGWFFTSRSISYRICDLFDDYADGYNWRFNEEPIDVFIYDLLVDRGFIVGYHGGDEEDGLIVFSKNPTND
jgi:hypothetical protein